MYYYQSVHRAKRTLNILQTSQDGGDSTSITSGIENEIRKPGGILKTKRSSIKRKVQTFSVESDDAVIEPLLQKDKEKIDTSKTSAKFNLMPKSKTEATSEKGTDKDKLISDDKLQKATMANASNVTDRILPTSNVKENSISKLTSTNAPLHNHMNTNVFSNHDGLKTFVAPKSQILVEIDGSKHVGCSPSPLIFTTAKIHTDGETKHMEPVQMAPGPILSTIEVSVMKNGINTGGSSGNVTSNISAVYIPQSNKNITESDPKPPTKTAGNATTSQNKISDAKIQMSSEKTDVKSNILDESSAASSSKDTKFNQSIYSPTNVKGNFTENKNRVTVQHDAKTGAIATSNVANNPIKESKNDKPEAFSYQENKVDLSKSNKPESLDLQRAIPSDKLNSSDKIKDKAKDTANASFSSRQLHRQSTVSDKDDPISKSNIVSPPLINDSKGFTLDDKTKLPKSSANSDPITSVHEIDSKTRASSTTTTAINKKHTSITNNTAVNQTAASITDSTVKNNSSVPVTTSVSANKSSFPITSSANKTCEASTTKLNTQNMSGAPKKVCDPIPAAAIKNTSIPNTTPAAVNKSSPHTNTSMVSNKINVPTTNIVAPKKVSTPVTITASNKISSPSTSIPASNKTPFTSSSTTTAGNKLFNATTSTVAANKVTASPTITTADSKLSKPITSTVAISKTSATSTTTTAGNKLSDSKTTSAATNKMSATTSTTTADSKISNPITISAVTNKTAAPSTVSANGNKVSLSSIATTAATNKISGLVISTTANKTTPISATTTAAVNKTSTSDAVSSGKPVTSTTSTLPTSSNTSITKPVVATSSSASRPSNVSNSGNIKAGTSNETSAAKSQVNAKPASSTTTAKPGNVATSQHSAVAKSSTVTAAKSAPNKTIPQPATTKSTISPKSSTSNEKPISAKSNITAVSSTTTIGITNVTSTASIGSSALASSASKSASVEDNKQNNSKSKNMSNGSKNFKA